MDLGQLIHLIGIGPLVTALASFVAAAVLKRWPDFPNKVIPWVTLILTAFGYTVTAKTVQAATGASPIAVEIGAVAATIIQTACVTGFHGFYKNAIKPAIGALGNFFLKRWFGG